MSEREIVEHIRVVMHCLRKAVADHKYVEVGMGTAKRLDVPNSRLYAAVLLLTDEGYVKHYLTDYPSYDKSVAVLTPPGTTYSEVHVNRDKIFKINSGE